MAFPLPMASPNSAGSPLLGTIGARKTDGSADTTTMWRRRRRRLPEDGRGGVVATMATRMMQRRCRWMTRRRWRRWDRVARRHSVVNSNDIGRVPKCLLASSSACCLVVRRRIRAHTWQDTQVGQKRRAAKHTHPHLPCGRFLPPHVHRRRPRHAVMPVCCAALCTQVGYAGRSPKRQGNKPQNRCRTRPPRC